MCSVFQGCITGVGGIEQPMIMKNFGFITLSDRNAVNLQFMADSTLIVRLNGSILTKFKNFTPAIEPRTVKVYVPKHYCCVCDVYTFGQGFLLWEVALSKLYKDTNGSINYILNSVPKPMMNTVRELVTGWFVNTLMSN